MFDFAYLKQWAARPFNPDMDMWGWVFLVVFILAIVFLWNHTLKMIGAE